MRIETVTQLLAISFVLACAVFGVYFVVRASLGLLFGRASRRWPTANGKIVNAPLKQGWLRTGQRVYWADISYVYTVGGRQHSGSRIGFSKYGEAMNNTMDKARAEAIVATYPTGREVPVYYLPRHPLLCTLEPGFNAYGVLAHLFLGSVFVTAAIILGFKVIERAS